MKDERVYLEHILECIARVERYTEGDRQRFMADTQVQDAVLRNLQTLAESTQRLSDRLKEAHPEVDWRAIAGFRNILVHDYLGVDLNRTWSVVANRLPVLKRIVEEILAEPGRGN